MAVLSSEMNRFLGCALLDPRLLQSLFAGDRANALQGFHLTKEESVTILASQAHTLPELSRDITAMLAKPDVADTEAQITRFYQSIHNSLSTPSVSLHYMVQKALSQLPAQASDTMQPSAQEDNVAVLAAS